MTKNIIATIIGIFLALFISEITLQLLDIPHRPISGWKNCRTKNSGECNSLGFRGREIEYSHDDFIVLLVGDSEVYAPAISFDKRAERSLEQYLKSYYDKTKNILLRSRYYRVSMKQYHINMKELFEGFEHYRIPLNMEDVTVKGPDEHLSHEAIDKLMRELSLIVLKSYFQVPVPE